MPTGPNRRHALRFERQQRGLGTYLLAWSDGVVVGTGEVRWDGCAAPEVAHRFPGCPELSALGVWPPEVRGQGIGTAILLAAEALARRRGHERIGLGVEDGNEAAARLYLRLGYLETGCRYLDRYHYVLADGSRHDVADPARFLVKELVDPQEQGCPA